jgi:hypothetical protein
MMKIRHLDNMSKEENRIPEKLLAQLQAELSPAFAELASLLKENPSETILLETGRYAVLNESGEVVPAATLMEWAIFMEGPQRAITLDKFGDYRVSTVFLGLNHQFMPQAPPLWFETMVFGPGEEREIYAKKVKIHPNLWKKRCSTRTEALGQHQEGIAWLKIYHLNPSQ